MMRRASLQTIAKEALSDAPLRGVLAERAVREVLARPIASRGHATTWQTRRLRTGHHAIAFVCRPDRGAEILIRVAWSGLGAETLEQQRRALTALELVSRLDGWRTLVPKVLEQGSVRGLEYLIETVIPGVDGRCFARADQPAAAEATARAIAPLYAATARTVGRHELDGPACELVREPLAVLRRACRSTAREPLERLGDRLERVLVEHPLSFSRVHGDLWLGNAMFTQDGATVTGLVDWASSSSAGLPAVDLAHMLLSSRAIASRRATGIVARGLLDGTEPLEPFERELLATHGGEAGGVLRADELVLLAWLQHIGHVLGAAKVWIPRLWRRHNVSPVLTML